jgi:hypothetical protein
MDINDEVNSRAGTGPAGPDRLRKSTGLVETGISPVENFEKSSFLTLCLPIKTKMSHIFLFRVQKKVLKIHVFQ